MAGSRPIERLFIANRGEVVCRIARTARRMGIDTVGVYSESDGDALHVDCVDLAVALGGLSPGESYLRGDLLIQGALEAGADALHPGYGFLAEDAGFARQVAEAGLIWVGPTAEQIELLGDKLAAKRVALEAGVPSAPTFESGGGEVPDTMRMPVMIKAAAGGGGRGMRIVRDIADLPNALEAASREAAAAFGSGEVFIEPYLEGGRHVEVQIIGDAHGNVIHLGERECSIQRRHQKIVEEAPSPGITANVRRELCDGAVALARRVGYQNAGTVEFLIGDDGTVNFLEVNTRLQVEHPVTEAVTGLDLVELQLMVAAGDRLPLTQGDVVFDGHAIEARLVAEDPSRGWLPTTGAIRRFSFGPEVRVDSGVRAGSVASPDYDSLLAKIISHAPHRTRAAAALAGALRGAAFAGPPTNIDALVAILEEPDFLAGQTSTAYLDGHPEVALATGPQGDDRVALFIAAVVAVERRDRAEDVHWGFAPSGWRNVRTQGQRSVWRDAARGTEQFVEYVFSSADCLTARLGPWPTPGDDGSLPADDRRTAVVRILSEGPGSLALEVEGLRRLVAVDVADEGLVYTASRAGRASWQLVPRFVMHDAELAGSGPVAPLPGTVIEVAVEVGDRVAEGDRLVVLEAMKMEHTITAPGPAVVTEVRVAPGVRVDVGDLMVHLEAVELEGGE